MKKILSFVFLLGFISCINGQGEGFNCLDVYSILDEELKLSERKNVDITFINTLSESSMKDLKYLYPDIEQKITSSMVDITKECVGSVKNLKRSSDTNSKGTFSISYPIHMENDHTLIVVNYHASPKSGYDQLFSFKFKDERWYLEEKKTMSVY